MKKKITADNERLNMHFGAGAVLFDLAEELRARMTPAEEKLWDRIKDNEWHLEFRRQHPLAAYIADFYCHKVKLVIELDGGYHQNKEVKIHDAARENEIRGYGITVLRFKNQEIINNIENVLAKIGETIVTIKNSLNEMGASSKTSSLEDSGKDSAASGKERDKLFIIKIGGNIIDDENALQSFLKDFAAVDAKKVLIHGGGKIATKIGEQLDIQPNYVNGRRITDADTINLVTMVYAGLINKKIVARLQFFACNAIGLTGADANLIPAQIRPVKETDFGFVGDVDHRQLPAHSWQLFLDNGLVPVIAPLTHDSKGQVLNTNADTIASVVAIALSKHYDTRLIYCFEKKGVLENKENDNAVIPLITKEKYRQLLADQKIADGILPKIDTAFAAIDNGVTEVLIGHAGDLLQNCTEKVKGTLFK